MKSSPQPGIKVHIEIRYSFSSVLPDFQSFTKKPVFECPFAGLSYGIILIISGAKNSIYHLSVVCKLAMEWYLMRMCSCSLYPFKTGMIAFLLLFHFIFN